MKVFDTLEELQRKYNTHPDEFYADRSFFKISTTVDLVYRLTDRAVRLSGAPVFVCLINSSSLHPIVALHAFDHVHPVWYGTRRSDESYSAINVHGFGRVRLDDPDCVELLAEKIRRVFQEER